jgi:hypothetical protein
MDHGIVGTMAVMSWADAKWRLERMCWLVKHGIVGWLESWSGFCLLSSTLSLRRRFWARELCFDKPSSGVREARTQWIGLRRPDDLVFNGI